MALSKGAQKLLAYLGIYKLTPTQYANRISGAYPYEYWYNVNWFIGTMDQGGYVPRVPASAQTGEFKTNLKELLDAGY